MLLGILRELHESMESFKLSSRNHCLSTAYAADKLDVTRRRIQKLIKEYKDTGKVPIFKKRGRKSYHKYSD